MGSNWAFSDTEARFAALAEAAIEGEPQRVVAEDGKAVVIVSAHTFDLMSKRQKTFVEHILDFPKLPEGMDDIFDRRDDYPSRVRDIDFD